MRAPDLPDSVMAIEYRTLPVPAFVENTAMFVAGAITIGVEYRHLDEAVILAFYGPDARAKFDNITPAGMGAVVEEDGVALHVFGTEDGAEYLRFDCFDDAPHYHYLDPATPRNVVVDYDAVAGGPVLSWALNAIEFRVGAMLAHAGAAALAARVDADVVGATMVQVREAAKRAQAVGRPVRV
jgi:hypothetical protein